MVPGVPGLTGLSVPRAVKEELRPGGDFVTVQPRPMVVKTVVVRALKRENVTQIPVQVRILSIVGISYDVNMKC